LNLQGQPSDVLPDAHQGSTTMLAEIFLLRLETKVREIAKEQTRTVSDPRFVPITPRA